MPANSEDRFETKVEQDLRADVDIDLPASGGHDVDVAIRQDSDDEQETRLDIDGPDGGGDETADVALLTRILHEAGIDIDIASQTRRVTVDLRTRIDQESDADSDISGRRSADDSDSPGAVDAGLEQTADVEMRTDVMIDIEEDDDGSIAIEIEIEIDDDSEVDQDVEFDDEDGPAAAGAKIDQFSRLQIDREVDVRIDDVDDVDVAVEVRQEADVDETGVIAIEEAPGHDGIDIEAIVAVEAQTEIGIAIDFG